MTAVDGLLVGFLAASALWIWVALKWRGVAARWREQSEAWKFTASMLGSHWINGVELSDLADAARATLARLESVPPARALGGEHDRRRAQG